MTHDTAVAQALIHQKRAYKCGICGWWHIGGGGR
jgi:hypothetical protein